MPHRVRPEHKKAHPVHVTLRARVSELRDFPVFEAVATALARGSKDFFRVCEYSVQHNHIHLIVEADDTDSLSRGMQGLVARIAKAVNRAMHRKGAVFADHYHAHELRKPTEVRNALVYVLNNWKKHLPGGNRGLDGCSSGEMVHRMDRSSSGHAVAPLGGDRMAPERRMAPARAHRLP